MWQSLKRLNALLSPRQRIRAVLLTGLLIGNALIEMIGVGLVPVYIGILAQPERLLQNERVIQIVSLAGFAPEHFTLGNFDDCPPAEHRA